MPGRCTYQSCPKLYEDYYSNQVGHGLPVFIGGRSIRGHGLGSLLAGIGRAVVPLLKRGGKALLREGARTGLQVAQDVMSGQRVGTALKQRTGQAGRRLVKRALSATGSGTKQKRIKTGRPSGRKQNKSPGRRGRKQQQQQQRMQDIFG